MTFPRINGLAEWTRLDAGRQTAIGMAAIELVAAWEGLDAQPMDDPRATPESRAFEAAEQRCADALSAAVKDAVTVIESHDPPLLPSLLGQVCRRCGCSQEDGCGTGCGWTEPGLCTSCTETDEAPA